MKSTDEYQKDQDSGGIRPGVGRQPASGGSKSGDDKLRNQANVEGPIGTGGVARTVSTAGQTVSRACSLDACEAGVPSGRSDIDPGGSSYNSKPGSRDQD